MKRLASCCLISLLAACEADAQNYPVGATFLRLPASTRALALGGYPANGGDEAAIFYNPAQIVGPGGRSAGMSVQRHIQSTTLGALAATVSLWGGTVGLGIQALDYGSADEITADPASGLGSPTGKTISAVDYAVSLGYALARGRVRMGGSLKLVRQQIAGASGGTGAVDAGVAVTLWRDAGVAMALNNLGGRVALAGSTASLPRLVRFGVASPSTDFGPIEVRAVAHLLQEARGDAALAGGAELSWQASQRVTLNGRAGASERKENAASVMTFGAGLRMRNLALDYAHQGFEAFGAAHRFGIRWWTR